MMGNLNIEKTNYYRQTILDHIKKNPSTQTNQVCKLIFVGHRRASTLLMMLTNCGEIYRAGHHNITRYWISEEAYKADSRSKDDEKKKESSAPHSKFNRHRRTTIGSMIFLNRKRPAGINTIFDECRQNSTILPVLRVMARRLYG